MCKRARTLCALLSRVCTFKTAPLPFRETVLSSGPLGNRGGNRPTHRFCGFERFTPSARGIAPGGSPCVPIASGGERSTMSSTMFAAHLPTAYVAAWSPRPRLCTTRQSSARVADDVEPVELSQGFEHRSPS
eukprot:5297745-Prymnesium_polylepis.1